MPQYVRVERGYTGGNMQGRQGPVLLRLQAQEDALLPAGLLHNGQWLRERERRIKGGAVRDDLPSAFLFFFKFLSFLFTVSVRILPLNLFPLGIFKIHLCPLINVATVNNLLLIRQYPLTRLSTLPIQY